MAVLTALDERDARDLSERYGLGHLTRLDPIRAGSVNSNFSLEAGGRRLFLRVYEERDTPGAAREAAMLTRLARRGVPTPAPLAALDGRLVTELRGKPLAVFPWRDGSMRCQASVTEADAHRVGEALAKVHVAGRGEEAEPGRFRFEDLLARLDLIAAARDPVLASLAPGLRDDLARSRDARDSALPGGLTHGDLFRDNVLWDARGAIAALLDFESACQGTYVYDFMVTVLAWCVGGDLDRALAQAMRAGYESVRPFATEELRSLHAEACFGALRFTITRITDFAMRTSTHGPREVKDWRRFRMRFDKLEALGEEGVRRFVGA